MRDRLTALGRYCVCVPWRRVAYFLSETQYVAAAAELQGVKSEVRSADPLHAQQVDQEGISRS